MHKMQVLGTTELKGFRASLYPNQSSAGTGLAPQKSCPGIPQDLKARGCKSFCKLFLLLQPKPSSPSPYPEIPAPQRSTFPCQDPPRLPHSPGVRSHCCSPGTPGAFPVSAAGTTAARAGHTPQLVSFCVFGPMN